MGAFPASEPRPRILVADDHALFAEALQCYLAKPYAVVGVVHDGRAMVEESLRLSPDLVVADIGMPILNGLEAAHRIKTAASGVKFVFLTMHNDPNLVAAALDLGRIGFVLKCCPGPELTKAIDRVLRGQTYLTPRLRHMDWVEINKRRQLYAREMTPRQKEVIQLLAEGQSIKQVASLLDLSIKTVEFHKHTIMDSFCLNSNADLVLFALQKGLISVDA